MPSASRYIRYTDSTCSTQVLVYYYYFTSPLSLFSLLTVTVRQDPSGEGLISPAARMKVCRGHAEFRIAARGRRPIRCGLCMGMGSVVSSPKRGYGGAFRKNIEWQERSSAHKNPVVVPASLSFVTAPAHPGYPGLRAVNGCCCWGSFYTPTTCKNAIRAHNDRY